MAITLEEIDRIVGIIRSKIKYSAKNRSDFRNRARGAG